jgi:predicted nucleic acid-binding protein
LQACSPGTSENQRLSQWLASGQAVGLDVIVWAEFLCGPVVPQQAALAAGAFPGPVSLLPEDAVRAAAFFNASGRRRGSLADCLIAAICVRLGASLATNNTADFQRFTPMGLKLI